LGEVPRRLAPIFRDREELSAAHDLSTEVKAALQQSACLIVVCSREAAASQWVSREVELFRALHPDRPLLAAICSGNPPDCFPQSLLRRGADGEAIEPLAADFRKDRDGEQHGLLKLVAGIVGIGLDELIQRDAQRRVRRVTAITVLALVAMLVMSALTIFALNARSEAERQRGEAERRRGEGLGLVGYMDTDLLEKLRSVGRTDLMEAVNERALEYFNDKRNVTDPQTEAQRDEVLQAIGEAEGTRGEHAAAMKHFKEAERSTRLLLAESPTDPNRIYGQAQSEYWIGYEEYSQGHFDRGRERFIAYHQLAQKLISISPRNPRYIREVAYAEGNLCAIDLAPPQNPPEAVALCTSAFVHMARAAKIFPGLNGIQHDLSNRESWLGSAYWAVRTKSGDFDSAAVRNAEVHWQAQEIILGGILAANPLNMNERNNWISLQRNLARVDVRAGRIEKARSRLSDALRLMNEMVALDPSNTAWASKGKSIESELAELSKERNEK